MGTFGEGGWASLGRVGGHIWGGWVGIFGEGGWAHLGRESEFIWGERTDSKLII